MEETEDRYEKVFSPRNIVVAIITIAIASLLGYGIGGAQGFLVVILPPFVIIAGMYSIFVFFAPRDLFFTSVQEGNAKAIMKGTKDNPEFVRLIMSYDGYKFDKDWNIVAGKEKHLLGGIRWLGLPGLYWVHRYKFRWTSMIENGTLETKEKVIDYIYVKRDVYAETLKKAEVGNSLVPVDVRFLITAQVINPYKALFRVEKWLEYITNRVKVPARDYVAQQEDPKDLVVKKQDLGPLLHKKLEEAGTIEDFKKEVGVEILKLETPEIDLGAFQEQATAQWKAKQEGDAAVIKGTKEGEAYKARRLLEKEGDVGYIEAVFAKVQEFGHAGLVLSYLDKLTKIADKQGNIILSLGSIGDIARQIFPTKETASDIAEMVEGLAGGKKHISKENIEKLRRLLASLEKPEEGE